MHFRSAQRETSMAQLQCQVSSPLLIHQDSEADITVITLNTFFTIHLFFLTLGGQVRFVIAKEDILVMKVCTFNVL